jgi:putative ABC transport system permease protein
VSFTRFFRRRRWDDERAREIQAHLAHEIDDNVARGMRPADARAAAYRRFGNPTRVREEIYDMNSLSLFDSLWQDLHYGLRLLRRNPTFSVVAILTLALGTGANTAIFELVNAVRLRALPVEDPERLVEVRVDTHDKGRTGNFMSNRPLMTEPLFRRVSEAQAFEGTLAYGSVSLDLASGGESRPVEGIWVDGGFFSVLGVKPASGRLLTPTDDRAGCGTPAAVLSNAFWRRNFGASPSAIGASMTLNGQIFQVIGVTPPEFFGVEVGRSFDVALPLCAEPLVRGEQSGIGKADVWFLDVIGRLRPGVTRTQADAQLGSMSNAIFRSTVPGKFTPKDQADYLAFTLTTRDAETGVSSLRADYSTPLWLLLGGTAVVLLIACANLANLLLARATAREREIAVRLAMGASRRRVVRQMVAESALIAAFGAMAGLLFANWFSRLLVAFLNTQSARVFIDLGLDWRVFLFTAGIAAAAALFFGLAPALRSTRLSLSATMRSGGRGTTDGRERFGLRRALVVAQVSLSLVLITSALLLGRTYHNLVSANPGFRQDGILVASLDLRRTGVDAGARPTLTRRVGEALSAIPGVAGVAETFLVPVSGAGWNNRVVVDGQLQPGAANLNQVSADYFAVLATPVIAGRVFDPSKDTPESEPVAVVNQAFAAKFFGGRAVIGETFQTETAGPDRPRYRVVGVVANTKYGDLREAFEPIAYFARSQQKTGGPFAAFLLHTTVPPARVTTLATAAITAASPRILVQYRTLSDQIAETLVSERLMAALSLGFGVLAIVIATIGLYGVMAYMVARRRSEIGIRLALGAGRSQVVRMIIAEASILLGIGAAIGLGLSIASGRAVGSLLYGLQPTDPLTLATAVAGLALVSLLASWLPAHRASLVPPTIALREE